MEELPSEELKDINGGKGEQVQSKLISRHVKNRERYKIQDIAKIDGNSYNVFLVKAHWVYGGNNCAVILNGSKYDASNTNRINKDKDISTAVVEFYKDKPESKALVYVELGFKIKPVRESKIVPKMHIVRINVFID